MKRVLALVLLAAACSKPDAPTPQKPPQPAPAPAASASAAPEKSAAELEKEKALASPYPNDLGPERLPAATLAAYTPEMRNGYELLIARCAQCHTAARPLNSRFVELEGKEAALAALRKKSPELFQEPAVWQIEAAVWNRYVKRMMSKPGCEIETKEGKAIWRFLVLDGERRKLGPNADSWRAHRRKLLAEFRAKHPARYAELEKSGDL